MFKHIIILATLTLTLPAFAVKTIGNPNAPQGGSFLRTFPSDPTTLNPINSSDAYATIIQDLVMDYLAVRNVDTFELMPGLAEKWEVSKDQMTFTFYLRKDATFHDGKPVTAEDVKFSFDAVFDNRYNAAPKRSYFDSLDKVEVVDPHTVKFHMKKKYFNNLDVLAVDQMHVVPKHVYGDPSKKNNKTLMGSGPYIFEKWDQGKSITLKRNPKWWGNNVEHLKGYYNHEKQVFRIIKEENAELELFKKGELSFIGLSPEQYMKKTDGPMWGKTVIKKEVENSSPKGYGFIGWNLKNPLFKDRDVRVALTHLLNRKLMIEKFAFNKSEPATGPWYKQSDYANPNVKPIPFDPNKARELLTKAGWTDSDKNGVLDKMIDGKKVEFRFTLLNPSADFEKYFTIYKEDLKKAGIDMAINLLEWNAFIKKLDERQFEAVALAWTAEVEIDPKQIWHSASIADKGSNFISYSNPEVDKLIDEARGEMDRKKRIKVLQKVYEMIANDAPYAFLFNTKYIFYGHNVKEKMLVPTRKYSIGVGTWWQEK